MPNSIKKKSIHFYIQEKKTLIKYGGIMKESDIVQRCVAILKPNVDLTKLVKKKNPISVKKIFQVLISFNWFNWFKPRLKLTQNLPNLPNVPIRA